ncbi:MAG: glucose-6-phosphate isomerase [Alphaproteobacteria bacterium]|nr:glucose-6-phosphate isomerase [Alphaproteobacteria bacterium]
MSYQQTIETCFDTAIGEGGLSREAFEKVLARTAQGIETLRRQRAEGNLALLALPEAREDLAALNPLAARYRQRFDRVVILGTGGSSLGGRTLTALREEGAAPRLQFLDNVDPQTFEACFAAATPKKTGFLVISKSGDTAETLVQFFAALDWVRTNLGDAAIREHFTIVTEPGDNALRRLGERWAIPCLDHDPGIGGRFSVLSLVGLLPAMIAGLDAAAVRQGAADVLERTLKANRPSDSQAAIGAALHVAFDETKAIRNAVFMPYLDRLDDLGRWHRQLWAESLGKDGHGTTPIQALGTVDQHSQLQLYLDGPKDKFFTLLFGESRGKGPEIPKDLAEDPALDWLAGRRMGDLLEAEGQATAETLVRHGCPVRSFRVATADEAALGTLFMHFMLETILAADLLGIDAFTQPAVEEGKRLAREYLSRMTP